MKRLARTNRTAGGILSSLAAGSLLLSACVAPAASGGATGTTNASASSTQTTTRSTAAPTALGAAGSGGATQGVQVAGARAAITGDNPAVAVYQTAGPSVVNITSVAVVQTSLGIAQQPQGIGSGFIVDADGRIVTNNHVVQDADQLTVTFQDRTTVPAKLVGRDPDNDLAVIQVDPNATDDSGNAIRSRIKPASLGDSGQVAIGQAAIAIGSPLGLQQTVTEGIVSALRNPGEQAGAGADSLDLLGGAIQTDAAINPGNSGGPLLDANAQVIGVDAAILSQSGGNIGIGFAIPINVAKRVVPELIQSGCYHHPLVGVTALSLAAIGQAAKQQLGIPTNQKGLLVQDSSAGAAQAGIRAGGQVVNLGGTQVRVGGDIIVAVDGQPVATGGELRALVENGKHPGDNVVLGVLRNGQRQDVNVRLTQRPSDPPCQ
jgi:S1-C subfamily serine protease